MKVVARYFIFLSNARARSPSRLHVFTSSLLLLLLLLLLFQKLFHQNLIQKNQIQKNVQRFEWISSSDLRIDRQILTLLQKCVAKISKWDIPIWKCPFGNFAQIQLQGTSPMENDEKELKEMEIPLKRKKTREREKAPPNLTWTFEG